MGFLSTKWKMSANSGTHFFYVSDIYRINLDTIYSNNNELINEINKYGT